MKTCPLCGTVCRNIDSNCYACGVTFGAPPPSWERPPDAGQGLAPPENYARLDGWLLVLVILAIAMALLLALGFTKAASYAGIDSMESRLQATSAIFYVVVALFIALSLRALFRRSPSVLRITQIGFALFLISDLIEAVTYPSVSSIGTLVGTVATAVAVTAYYCRSVRVHVYLRSDEYTRRALFRI